MTAKKKTAKKPNVTLKSIAKNARKVSEHATKTITKELRRRYIETVQANAKKGRPYTDHVATVSEWIEAEPDVALFLGEEGYEALMLRIAEELDAEGKITFDGANSRPGED